MRCVRQPYPSAVPLEALVLWTVFSMKGSLMSTRPMIATFASHDPVAFRFQEKWAGLHPCADSARRDQLRGLQLVVEVWCCRGDDGVLAFTAVLIAVIVVDIAALGRRTRGVSCSIWGGDGLLHLNKNNRTLLLTTVWFALGAKPQLLPPQ